MPLGEEKWLKILIAVFLFFVFVMLVVNAVYYSNISLGTCTGISKSTSQVLLFINGILAFFILLVLIWLIWNLVRTTEFTYDLNL